jgi:MATE family multidrug resistance protein
MQSQPVEYESLESRGPTISAHPLRELVALALPTVAQMVSYTLMQFIDTWMLARALGPMAPTAASNAGSLSFAFIGFGIGVLLVVNTLVSQNYGQKNFANCGRYLWQGVWFALLFAVLLLPLMPLMPRAFAWFGHDPSLIAMERVYVYFMLASAGIKLVQTSFSQFMLATNRPGMVLISSVAGVTVNAVAAGVMIFGALGAPRLGVTGAAIAQVLGLTVEMSVLVVLAMRGPNRRLFNTTDWKFRPDEFRKLVTVGFGSGIQLIAEILAWALFMNLVMGELGANEMAAMAFMLRYLVVSFLPAVGISSAVTALVGRYIGMKRPDLAMSRAHLGFKVTLAYLVLCGLAFLVGRRELIELFTTQPEVVRMGMTLLIFAAFYQVFDGMYIVYYGALRGAGDTFVPAVFTAVLCWTIMLGGGYLAARYFKAWSVAGPWAIASVYGVVLGIWMFLRFNRGRWQAIHLEKSDESNRREELTTVPKLVELTVQS